jgi:hypothetical protein
MAKVPAEKMIPDWLVVIPGSLMMRGSEVSKNPVGKAIAKAIKWAGQTAIPR